MLHEYYHSDTSITAQPNLVQPGYGPGPDPTPVSEVIVVAEAPQPGAGDNGGNWYSTTYTTSGPPTNFADGSGFNIANQAAFKYILNHVKTTANLNDPAEKAAWDRATDEIWQDVFQASLVSHESGPLTPIYNEPTGQTVSAGSFLADMNSILFVFQDAPTQSGGAADTLLNTATGQRTIEFSMPALITNADGSPGYASIAGGIEYATDHEIGHATARGEDVASQERANYVGRTQDTGLVNYGKSPEFGAQEAYANSLALSLANFSAGVTISNPSYGYWQGYV